MTTAPLYLDQQTLKDLEVFQTETGPSLFEHFNFTFTDGGARALKRRMENPWRSRDQIIDTQRAITFINGQRAHFQQLNNFAYTANRVDHYLQQVLPVIDATGKLEFTLAAFSLWANHDRHFNTILVGVQLTARFIRALRTFISDLDATEANAGELAPLIEELETLLMRPRLLAVPEEAFGLRYWLSLRLDQTFRVYESSTLKRIVTLIHELDGLVSLAEASHQHGYVLPAVTTGSLTMEAEALVHPFVNEAIGNPLAMDQTARVLFLTGPNMAGKTTYIRAIATALYCGHLGMGVPAKQFSFTPADSLFSAISLSDDLRHGISFFRAEALRVKAVAAAIAAGQRVIAMMDEPFKGTNLKDALDASGAVLTRFAQSDECLFVVSSHLIELSEQADFSERMQCRYFDADESEGQLRFDYQIREGISDQRLGMRVLKEEGIFDLLDARLNPDN